MLHGKPLYSLTFLKEELQFTYTPTAALLFAPIALLPEMAATVLWTAASIGALVAIVWISLRMVGLADRRERLGLCLVMAAAALWLEPVLWHLLVGQIDLLLTALILADLSRPDAKRSKGIGLGVAAGVKLVPAVLILYLLATRRWRAAAVSTGVFAATIALGFAALPTQAARYFGELVLDPTRVGPLASPSNQSLQGIITRLVSNPGLAHTIWFNAAFIAIGVGLYLATKAHRAGEELMAIVVCALSGVLATPIAWTHHWVWVIPGLIVWGRKAWERRIPKLWAGLAAVAAVFVAWPTWLWPQLPSGWHWAVITTGSWGLNGATELLAITDQAFAGYTRLLETAYPAMAVVALVLVAKDLKSREALALVKTTRVV